MANIRVSYEEMQSAAARLRQGQAELEQKLTEMGALVNGLVGSGFVTQNASGAFSEAYASFTQGAKQAVSGANEMASFLTKAAEIISATDAELARAIR